MKTPKLPWKPKGDVAENLEAVLPVLVHDFFAHGRTAAGSDDPAELHLFRLAAKQFRYTLEFLKPVYNEELDSFIAPVKELQDHLGRINDCATSLALLESHDGTESEGFRGYLTRQQSTETEAFREFWRLFDQHETEERWVQFLCAPRK